MDVSLTIRLSNLGVTEEESQISEPHVRPQVISDEKLIAQICLGNKEALADLFRRHAKVVRGVAYRVLRDASEADDLLQDIFLLVYRLCGTFDSSKGSARFWILQMTYRRAISRRRYLNSRHFYTHLDLNEIAPQLGERELGCGRSQASMHESIDRKQAMQSWLAELSENQRQTLHLFFLRAIHLKRLPSSWAKQWETLEIIITVDWKSCGRRLPTVNFRAKKQYEHAHWP